MSDSSIVEDGGPEAIVLERDGDQALWVRVGPVYGADGEQESDLGIWIYYQEKYMASDIQGPLLFSDETWTELNRFVRNKVRAHKRRDKPM